MPLMRGVGNGNIFVALAQPAGWGDGDLWIDTSTLPRKVKVNNNGAALVVSGEDVGSIKYWPAGTATFPTNFLLCNGAAISRTTYSDLFGTIGTLWGVGDGITTFNVPDLRGNYARGATIDGDIATAVGSDTVTLTVAQMPAHTHDSPVIPAGGGGNNSVATTAVAPAGSSTTTSTGGGASHENRPASKHCYFIIKAT